MLPLINLLQNATSSVRFCDYLEKIEMISHINHSIGN